SCLLAGADLAVLPFNHGVTLKSGSLLALLAHGLPVVASASEPPEPVLADEGLARLAPPRDPAALAAALAALLDDPAQRERLARAGTAYVAHLNWPATVERHRALYAQLIAARAAPISGVRPPVPRASKPRALD
ncbi:MAG TPA: glycosyltransferase, partial [Candidatus Limnocylindria bacterium]|nr:glycosyltransferase [Candidatus Limnocylindria bacterium]